MSLSHWRRIDGGWSASGAALLKLAWIVPQL
jgi:hypothetical protein